MTRLDLVAKCRGLPFTCTERDLRDFFGAAAVSKVVLTKNRDGRASGEAFVTFESEKDFEYALTKDRQYMGKRYVEVFAASPSQVEYNIAGPERRLRMGISLPSRDTYLVRLKGLPYGCTNEEISRFFHPLPIAANGIVMPYDHRSGRETGEAFVAFYGVETASEALKRDRNNIQHRYIELFAASYGEMLRAMDLDEKGGSGEWDRGRHPRGIPYDRPGGESRRFSSSGGPRMRRHESWGGAYGGDEGYNEPYGSRSGGGPLRRGWRDEPPPMSRGGRPGRHYGSPPKSYALRMRGLPYRATERDVADFFYPLRVGTIDLLLEYGTGRASGEAIVEFYSLVDRDDALRRDKKYMGSRYIELFPED